MTTPGDGPALAEQVTLLELVDRVLNKGVVLSGDLIDVGLRVRLASVGTLERLHEQGDAPALEGIVRR